MAGGTKVLPAFLFALPIEQSIRQEWINPDLSVVDSSCELSI